MNNELRIKNLIIILILFGLILPIFSFAQAPPSQFITPPETLEEAREMGEKTLKFSLENLPEILKKIWEEEVLPIWKKMYDWFKINIWPKIETWFKKEVEPRAKEEIEKRKPVIEEEFKKEKEELKETAPTTWQTILNLWEKFKELIK